MSRNKNLEKMEIIKNWILNLETKNTGAATNRTVTFFQETRT